VPNGMLCALRIRQHCKAGLVKDADGVPFKRKSDIYCTTPCLGHLGRLWMKPPPLSLVLLIAHAVYCCVAAS
jgi:hypothetical protein